MTVAIKRSQPTGYDNLAIPTNLIQDDFEDGIEVRVIGGKSLPEDRQFKYEQAQEDIKNGIISPVDYFETAGYDNPQEKAKNKVIYDLNAPKAVGVTDEEMQMLVPEKQVEEVPKTSIKYGELPPDGKVQLAANSGIELDPELVVAEQMKIDREKKIEVDRKYEMGNKSIDSKVKKESTSKKEQQVYDLSASLKVLIINNLIKRYNRSQQTKRG